MTILTQDIKLLKSAVMADTTDGGGQMTGNQVVDGVSNNLFPDTSALDRAFGRVNMRKVFGVAHTSNTDTLLGCHAIITDPPDDELVHCSMIKTTNWSDTRTAARELIEKYLVKGPKAGPRIYDTHYQGSMQLRLISPSVGATFPSGGDALVLRNPNGVEQFVRVRSTTITTQQIFTSDSNGALVSVSIATLELGQALTMDVLGPPATKNPPSDTAYASLYTTNVATGAKFFGVKKLGVSANIDDTSVVTEGGIYTPVVPAATLETPVIDVNPFKGRGVLADTSYSVVAMPSKVMNVGPNTVIHAASSILPTSVSLTLAGITFTDANGLLLQGTVTVGAVNYVTGDITFAGTAGNYGSQTVALSFRCAGAVSTPGYSSSFPITIGNGGLSYVSNFSPVPAPGSLQLSYMAQGRWYDLNADLAGKLAGADSSYGVGQVNANTGSMAVTLGATPDVGSALVATWGVVAGFQPTPIADIPTKFSAVVTTTTYMSYDTATITWVRGGTTYTATTDVFGAISGDATGRWRGGKTFTITPNIFPDNAQFSLSTVQRNLGASYTAFTPSTGTGPYTLSDKTTDVQSGAVFGSVYFAAGSVRIYVTFYDRSGVLYARQPSLNNGAEIAVGTINYSTGVLTLTNVTLPAYQYGTTTVSGSAGWVTTSGEVASLSPTITFTPDRLYNVLYHDANVSTTVVTPTASVTSWVLGVSNHGGTTIPDAVMFSLGGELYSCQEGTLRKGWDVSTGVGTAAGVVTADGTVTLTSLPSNGVNTVTWYSFGQNVSSPKVSGGTFRTDTAPLKPGVFQFLSGALVASTNEAGAMTNGGFTGTVDFARGLVKWQHTDRLAPSSIRYNAVFLEFLPLDPALLGIDTARLPLDGKVPIYRSGDLVVVHNTQTYAVTNPLTKGTAYDMGRVRIASVRVKDSLGVVVPDTLYTTDLNAGLITFPVPSNITPYTQPFAVEHRIEDMLLCLQADISGTLKFTRGLTHAFPAGTSYVSSALPFGDLFARAHTYVEQATWTSVWSDERIGAAILPNYNEVDFPIQVTNRGTIKERWAIIFTGSSAFRVIGEYVGEIAAGNTAVDCAPINSAVSAPYFTIPAQGWGVGSWAVGNVLRFNTDASGAAMWVLRTVLQGPASLDSDQFSLAFRGDIDRP
jgi:hypothetical protein